MAWIFSIAWPFALVPCMALFLMSGQQRFRWLAGSAAHPFNIVGFFTIVIAFDFLDVYSAVSAGGVRSFARYVIATESQVVNGLTFYLLMVAALVGGTAIAMMTPQPVVARASMPAHPKAGGVVLMIALCFASLSTTQVLLASLEAGSVFHVASIRQTFFRENTAMQVLSATLVPAFIVFLANNSTNRTLGWVALAACAMLLIPMGSRGSLFYLGIASLTALVAVRTKVPAVLLYLGAPVILVAVIFLRFLRETRIGSFEQYLAVQGSDLLIGGADFSTAEAIIVGLQPDALPRAPLDSVLGAIVAPIPRALITWKPEGASALFSSLADPVRWGYTKSEWLVTGFINLHADFGLVGAVVAMFALSALWAHFLSRAAGRGDSLLIVAASFLAIVAYIFLRGDLYNVALFLWPTMAVWLIYRTAVRLLGERCDTIRSLS